ncbi:reverse transcriptase, putative [Blumeria hordei DH14]|uniref:Reverse transcriptase, putative n=1 Tax=Blumeria graminis f. sp. hordei (strain DH14) TaxID=546991 RepID=N1JMI1_BLUG1|nr:reverse transcriptase, putative [Blumeria hordei DH14]
MCWVGSFASCWTVCVCLDGVTGPPQHVDRGLPQGSSASPVLFMLYISPLFKMGMKRKRFGYADDIALLETGPSLLSNCTDLSHLLVEAIEWGDIMVSEDPNKPYTHWLGVHFDRTLSFKWHERPQLIRQTILACTFPIAYYGAETWWPGRIRYRNRLISNRVEGHLSTLRKVILTGARAILPVYRTTPIPILYRESGLLPPDLELDSKSKFAALRIQRLDPRHPFRRVTHPFINLPSGIPFRDIAVYIDGARSEIAESPRTCGGIVIFQAGQMIYRESLSLELTLSPFDTELTAALSQDWPLHTRLPHIHPEKVKVHWIPSQSGILGNDLADASARERLSKPTPLPRGYVSFDTAKNRIKAEISTAMKDYWDRHAPVSYIELVINSYSRDSKELSLARPFLSRLYAVRSGHGDFAEYYRLFNHEGANLHCGCGQLKAPLHFLECYLTTHRPPRAPASARDPKKILLGT